MQTRENIKITIISGFLGAGKTTLIKKMLDESVYQAPIAIIENEFGDIRIDAGRLEQTGVEIRSITSGCICCTLSGDFKAALETLVQEQRPARIIIEPTGIGRLSDIIGVIRQLEQTGPVELELAVTVVDAMDFEDYLEVFGDFFTDQIRHADIIALSKTQLCADDTVETVIDSLRRLNPAGGIVAAPWEELGAGAILNTSGPEQKTSHEKAEEGSPHEHSHDRQSEDSAHSKGHYHDEDPIFEQWSMETMRPYPKEALEAILASLNEGQYGRVLRAKGSLPAPGGLWLEFDLVPGHYNILQAKVSPIGQAAVIGQGLKLNAIAQLFGQERKKESDYGGN